MALPTTSTKILGQVQLGTGLTTIYTPPTGTGNLTGRVNAIWICNTDSAARTFTLRHGVGSLTVANSLAEAVPINGNTTYVLSGSEWIITLATGSQLQALADAASKITVTVYGDETV